jgi:aromatic-L-amino-acid decarboxylase
MTEFVNATQSLSLGDRRHEALDHAAALVAAAWAEFDQAREVETAPSEELLQSLCTSLPELGSDVIAGLDGAAAILDASLAQARPRYFAYIGSSGLEVGALADLLAHSYDVNLAVDAGAASGLERQAITWLAEFLGYPAATGTFTSGGTVSNLTALAAARERALPGSRATGLGGTRAAIYCSAEAHYSITRAAELLGIGRNWVRAIPIDDERRMLASELEIAIRADLSDGVTPIAVIGTAGTTLTGTVDPIADLADVCERLGVWLHIDGAYGLPAAAAPGTASLFAGLERADSVTVDCHKWMFVPKACSAVLVRDTQALLNTFEHDEAYVPHEADLLNAVDITLEYSRPMRALKLWLAFKVHGALAFREAVTRNCEQAQFLYNTARAHERLAVLPTRPQLSIVPIRHLVSGCSDVNAHNASLTDRLQADGRVYVSPAQIDGQTWLRPCFTNFRTTTDDVRMLVAVVDELGTDCSAHH